MTPQNQNIACAKACGYIEPFVIENEYFENGTSDGFKDVLRDSGGMGRPIPNYHSSLDACHEMEKALKFGQQYACWEMVLYLLPEGASEFDVLHATAAQRCEAFLRTLNLWEGVK